jgi:hypothetical protein
MKLVEEAGHRTMPEFKYVPVPAVDAPSIPADDDSAEGTHANDIAGNDPTGIA